MPLTARNIPGPISSAIGAHLRCGQFPSNYSRRSQRVDYLSPVASTGRRRKNLKKGRKKTSENQWTPTFIVVELTDGRIRGGHWSPPDSFKSYGPKLIIFLELLSSVERSRPVALKSEAQGRTGNFLIYISPATDKDRGSREERSIGARWRSHHVLVPMWCHYNTLDMCEHSKF